MGYDLSRKTDSGHWMHSFCSPVFCAVRKPGEQYAHATGKKKIPVLVPVRVTVIEP